MGLEGGVGDRFHLSDSIWGCQFQLQESSGIGEKEFNAKIKMGVDFVGTTGVGFEGEKAKWCRDIIIISGLGFRCWIASMVLYRNAR